MSDKIAEGNIFIFRRVLLCFLLMAVIVVAGCSSGSVKKNKTPEYSFYELCFYFSKTPENTTVHDVSEASSLYVEHLEDNGKTVFKKRNYVNSACFFIDSVPDFSKPVKMSGNDISQYLLNAYFDEKSASLLGIDDVKNEFDVIFAHSSQRTALPIYFPLEEGVTLTGNNREIVLFARYLEVLEIDHQFGMNGKGDLIINLEQDIAKRWMMVPFLYESLDPSKFVSPKPGDYSIISECVDEKADISVLVSSWEKTEVPFIKEKFLEKEDSLLFSNSVLSLPFSDDVLVRYFYSLAGGHLLPPSSGLFYSPNFTGGIVVPEVYLLTSEIAIDGGSGFSPEKILLWFLSVNRELEEYPDTLYSNILSLKIAKKLYTGSPEFLGGSEMFNPTSSISFDSIRKYLLNKGSVSVFGSLDNFLYLNTDEIILEYPSFTDIKKVKGFKVFFGSPDMSEMSIVSIVFRSGKSFELSNTLTKMLKEAGYPVIQTLFEQISENDSWGAVSIKISAVQEKKFLEFFKKKIKNKDKTMSLGVYRVPE